MSEDRKKNIMSAVEKWSSNQNKTVNKRTKKNESPESDFVKTLLPHLRKLGFSIDVIESKAQWNVEAGMYLEGRAAAGYPDLSGCTSEGHAVYIECKAPGRRGSLRLDQYEFLKNKINFGAFAIVCDSINHFNGIWSGWKVSENKKSFLLSDLPKLSAKIQKDLDKNFDDWSSDE